MRTAWPTDDQQGYYWQLLKATADHFNIPTNVPTNQLSEAQLRVLLYGSGNEDSLKKLKSKFAVSAAYATVLFLYIAVIAYLFVSQVTQVGGFSPIAGVDRFGNER